MTIISHSRSFIFIRPRKVASTSVIASLTAHCGDDDVVIVGKRNVSFNQSMDDDEFAAIRRRNERAIPLSPFDMGHILPDRLRSAVGAGVWQDYYKFSVVRNPWDWFASLYNFKLVHNWRSWGALHDKKSLRGLALDARAQYRLRRATPAYKRGEHQENIEFILRKKWFEKLLVEMPAFYFIDDSPFLDYCIRFENLQQDYGEVCRRLGLPAAALPKLKTRTRRRNDDYRPYYTDWSRDYIAERCQPVIDAFGYEF